ncbi:Stk1 family PASTA domain-containing Ser/Thr kinase [Nakamurella sp. GG22]
MVVDPYFGLTSGTVLDGRYRVGALIARGGMSMVYRGVDTRLDRPVAIKVMSPQYVTDQAFLTRFEREARLAASLGHSGVVAVYDQGRDGDLVFLVMELVDGGTLRDLLREHGSLSVPVTLSVLEPLLAALGAAHAAGLVHRDVKPENVLISSRGEVKIADFGLVRAVTSQTMATGDVILGTVAYLSPEQVATGAADPRSDVYATGVMAYEMLTGTTPFAGDTPMSVAYQHVHSDVPPPADRAIGTPQALDELIVAATRRNPAARPRDASAFLAALVGVRSQLGLRRVPVPVPHRPAVLAGVSGTRVFAGPPPTAPAPFHPAPAPAPAPAPSPTQGPAPAPTAVTRRPVAAKSLRRRRWLIAILVILLLGISAAAAGWWLGGRWAATPAAVGLTRIQAEALIRDAGLVPRVSTGHQNTVPAGVVASSEPDAGSRQLRGSEVDLLVSSGRPEVPAIAAGIDPAAAAAAVKAAELTAVVGADKSFDDTVPAGAVVRTDPKAGTALPVGGRVTLVLSAGPAPLKVPDVTGKSAEDAENKLKVAGFALGPRQRTFDPVAEPGAVLGSTPGAGTTVPRGSTVSLKVADALTVPDVRGTATEDAVAALEKAGFTVTVGNPAFDREIDAGDILRTDPGPGTRVDPNGAAIFLVPSNAVAVPELTGGTVAQAEQQAAALGLSLSVSALFGAEDATVWDQSPGAGGRVEPGGTVSVSAFP